MLYGSKVRQTDGLVPRSLPLHSELPRIGRHAQALRKAAAVEVE